MKRDIDAMKQDIDVMKQDIDVMKPGITDLKDGQQRHERLLEKLALRSIEYEIKYRDSLFNR
jgi:hypothetical protein